MSNLGTPDFGGQKQQNAGASAGNPEQRPSSVLLKPDCPRPTQRFQANDPRLHTDASFRPNDGRFDGGGF